MFNSPNEFIYRYSPILLLSSAEMRALKELPEKDKDLILPIIPLRGWGVSKKLENSILQIQKVIGQRYWVADIDTLFLNDKKKEKQITGKYPRDVFYEIEDLLSPKNAYDNWFNYLSREEHSKAIPTIQLGDSTKLKEQIEKLSSLNRGVVVKFTIEHINSAFYLEVLQAISELGIDDVFIVFDYGQVTREILTFSAAAASIVKGAHSVLPSAIFSISCSSFPSSFSGSNLGEIPIYERQFYRNVLQVCEGVRMVYSDRGSARADKIGGGGGIPSPRIDYPLANDWRFIREEFEDFSSPKEGEKEALYIQIANDIMGQNYWNSELRVWGTQVIELTSKGERTSNGEIVGINSPIRSTAVRINIHMHQQLYYDAPQGVLLDTDEDWED